MTRPRLCVVPPEEDVEAYLQLELEASGPFAQFVYGDLTLARRIHRALVCAGEGELARPRGRLVRSEEPLAVAMYTAPLRRAELAYVRLRTTRALSNLELFRANPHIRERMRMARQLFASLTDEDIYLSRLAVRPDLRGHRIGERVFELFRQECSVFDARRIVLEVADDHAAARAFYTRLGFSEIERRSVERSDGSRLGYTHMALYLDQQTKG